MADNPYVNKVIYGGQTLIDISNDTVTATHLWKNVTAHDATGAPIIGSVEPTFGELTVYPEEAVQEFNITDYTGLWGWNFVTVDAVSATYVGSEVTRRTSTDLEASGPTITAPAGYYASSASKTVTIATLPTQTSTSSSGSQVAFVARSTANRYINIPTGYVTAAKYYTIEGVPNATLPTQPAASGTGTLKATISRSTSDQYINIPIGFVENSAYYKVSAVANMTLPTQASSTSSGTSKATIGRSTSDQYINIPVGYNTAAAYYKVSAVANGTAGTPTATKGTVSNHTINVTPSVTNTTGYITGGTKTGTAVSVSASELVSGTKTISANGTGIDVTNYASVDVALPEASLPTQSAASSTGTQQAVITPSGSVQYINIPTGLVPSAKYYKINAVEDSAFVITIAYDDNAGMWKPNKTFAEISTAYYAGKTLVTEISTDDPALYEVNGYYEEGPGGIDCYYYAIAEWEENLDFSLVQVYYGYLDAGGCSVDPPEIYYNTSIANASASEVAAGSVFFNDSGYQVGTATRRDSNSLTVSGATVTAPAGYYAAAASKTLSSATLPTQTSTTAIGSQIAEISATSSTRYLNVSGGGYLTSGGYYKINPAGTIPEATLPTQTSSTSSGTKKATISRNTSTRYLNIPTGQISNAAYYEIEGVPNGSATTPTTTISVTPTISVSATGLVTASGTASENITPTISAGYISSGTAGAVTASASNTYQLTRLTATAYNVSTEDQTIAAGQYITGQQRFKGVAVSSTLTAANIKSGVTITVGDADNASRITSVTGTYTGGGDTKIVTGTFTTPTTEGAASTVTIPYTGTGYPLMAIIVINEGIYNTGTTWYSSLHRYAVGQFTLTKSDFGTAPTYTTSGAANYGCTTAIYKNSTSNAQSYTRTSSVNANIYTSSNANSTATTIVRFKSKTSMSIFVSASSGTSYGLLANTTYRYWIYYSA